MCMLKADCYSDKKPENVCARNVKFLLPSKTPVQGRGRVSLFKQGKPSHSQKAMTLGSCNSSTRQQPKKYKTVSNGG